jgi:hypothetical protein
MIYYRKTLFSCRPKLIEAKKAKIASIYMGVLTLGHLPSKPWFGEKLPKETTNN